MLRLVDRSLAVILSAGAGIGHALGSLQAYRGEPFTLLWALNASVLGVMLGALHMLRSFRPADRLLAWLLVPPTLAWIASCVAFGVLIGNVADPRVLTFIVACAGLAALSAADGLGASRRRSASRRP